MAVRPLAVPPIQEAIFGVIDGLLNRINYSRQEVLEDVVTAVVLSSLRYYSGSLIAGSAVVFTILGRAYTVFLQERDMSRRISIHIGFTLLGALIPISINS